MMLDCREMRIDLMKMALAAKGTGAHLGGALSAVEIMAALYGGVMKFGPAAEKHDRLIFSKGHGVMAQYVALKQVGLLTEADLLTYKQTGSIVSAHPSVHQGRLGIDFASGSLGQGLSLGVGSALALRRKGWTSKVFVLLGDGECDEGAIWEAAMSAANYSLGNLIAIIDRNGLQYDGDTEDVLKLDDLGAKWRAFGWNVREVDGHDVSALTSALLSSTRNQEPSCAKVTESKPGTQNAELGTQNAEPGTQNPELTEDRPLAVIARTVKGKGVSFMENVPAWHHGILTQKLYDQAMAELTGGVA